MLNRTERIGIVNRVDRLARFKWMIATASRVLDTSCLCSTLLSSTIINGQRIKDTINRGTISIEIVPLLIVSFILWPFIIVLDSSVEQRQLVSRTRLAVAIIHLNLASRSTLFTMPILSVLFNIALTSLGLCEFLTDYQAISLTSTVLLQYTYKGSSLIGNTKCV